MFACLYRPPAPGAAIESDALVALAHDFSPRYERHGDDVVVIDVSGLGRLFTGVTSQPSAKRDGVRREENDVARAIGDELRRQAAARAGCVHVAIAATHTAALVLAHVRPGLTIVAPGEEAAALAPIPIGVLRQAAAMPARSEASRSEDGVPLSVFRAWGVRTLGELAALPPGDLSARLGRPALVWQAIARGDDVRPLVPALAEERFESSLDLEWPIEGLEPLSFVLTRLLEPLSARLERCDRGAAVLHVILGLVTRPSASSGCGEPVEPRETCSRRLELPSPLRDVRTLRTLALLDLESHPPAAAIDRVTIVIDPTPGRVLQHALFTRALPAPEQLSTLLARLGAVMGQDCIGAPAAVDSHRPGAFAMRPFSTEWAGTRGDDGTRARQCEASESGDPESAEGPNAAGVAPRAVEPDASRAEGRRRHEGGVLRRADHGGRRQALVSALRRCRVPVPARVATTRGVPVRVTTDRRGFAGGQVVNAAGPWRTSGEWWKGSDRTVQSADCKLQVSWNRDEWDVALGDGAVYRIFCDRDTERWFIDAVFD